MSAVSLRTPQNLFHMDTGTGMMRLTSDFSFPKFMVWEWCIFGLH